MNRRIRLVVKRPDSISGSLGLVHQFDTQIHIRFDIGRETFVFGRDAPEIFLRQENAAHNDLIGIVRQLQLEGREILSRGAAIDQRGGQ